MGKHWRFGITNESASLMLVKMTALLSGAGSEALGGVAGLSLTGGSLAVWRIRLVRLDDFYLPQAL
jgi:hypothetical protein